MPSYHSYGGVGVQQCYRSVRRRCHQCRRLHFDLILQLVDLQSVCVCVCVCVVIEHCLDRDDTYVPICFTFRGPSLQFLVLGLSLFISYIYWPTEEPIMISGKITPPMKPEVWPASVRSLCVLGYPCTRARAHHPSIHPSTHPPHPLSLSATRPSTHSSTHALWWV